jgi:RimJ/RimL family protein N-acetyltransferase
MDRAGRDCEAGVMFAPNVFPVAELKTERLLLRPHVEEDIEPTVRLFADELSRRWLTVPQPYTLEHARRWCTQTSHTLRGVGDGINWAITDRATGRFLGGIGLKQTNWLHRSTEVGYCVGSWARGQGYAPEATRAVAEWVLRDQSFNRVQLFAATENIASQRVAEKAGFVREGVARNSGYTHEGQVDMVMFALIPADLARP